MGRGAGEHGHEHPRGAVGILGGGQLARMLAADARALGLRPAVLAEEPDAPAAATASETVVGALDDEAALARLFARAPLATFENEFVEVARIRRAAEAAGGGVRLLPSLEAIEVGQDKLRQKRLFARLGVPTAPFLAFEPGAPGGVAAFLDRAYAELSGAPVFKWARMGYDGKGVLACEGTSAVSPERSRALAFCEAASARGLPLYAERRVDFVREVALVAARSAAGEVACHPLVVTEQRDGVCSRVRGPARALGVPEATERRAQEAARGLLEALDYIGILAVEMFLTRDGALVVNEIAPRVHNSAHYTQDAAATSQFAQHWRALLGLPLGSVEAAPAFLMQNLLGPRGVSRALAGPPRWDGPGRLEWYGKREARPGRKLGHVNAVARDVAELPALERAMDAAVARWEGEVGRG